MRKCRNIDPTPFQSFGYRELKCQNTSPQESRNREMRNAEIPKAGDSFGYRDLGSVSRTLTTGVPKSRNAKSRYAKPRYNLNHWIEDKTGPSIQEGYVAKDHPFADWKVKGTGFPNLSNSRYAKSRNNLSRQIEV
jgi:hypothetical protein